MSYINNKYLNIINRINLFALLLFVFWLPLEPDYLPAILAFWILTWLLEGNFKKRFSIFPNRFIYIPILIYFLLTITALLYTNNIDKGFLVVQQSLSILFFPLIIIGSNDKIKENFRFILLAFVFGSLIASIYVIGFTFFSNLTLENGIWHLKHWAGGNVLNHSFWELLSKRQSNFSGKFLSVLIHPSYFSMYLMFSIIILLYFIKQKYVKKYKLKVVVSLTIAFFVLMIFLLQSRAGFIVFFTATLFYVFLELKRYKNIKVFVAGIIVISISIIFLITSSKMQSGIDKFKNLFSNENKLEMIKQDARFETWYSSVLLIKDNFWIGTSPADLSDELEIVYLNNNFSSSLENKLNAHNQYLETFAGQGFFGFIALILILVFGFIIAYKKRHFLLFFLLLVLSINFLFESMMNRMAGILFMMFFYSLFVFSSENIIKKKE